MLDAEDGSGGTGGGRDTPLLKGEMALGLNPVESKSDVLTHSVV